MIARILATYIAWSNGKPRWIPKAERDMRQRLAEIVAQTRASAATQAYRGRREAAFKGCLKTHQARCGHYFVERPIDPIIAAYEREEY